MGNGNNVCNVLPEQLYEIENKVLGKQLDCGFAKLFTIDGMYEHTNTVLLTYFSNYSSGL